MSKLYTHEKLNIKLHKITMEICKKRVGKRGGKIFGRLLVSYLFTTLLYYFK
jgi:hypothetical protein